MGKLVGSMVEFLFGTNVLGIGLVVFLFKGVSLLFDRF